MSISDNQKYFLEELEGTRCKLVAITKTRSESEIRELYEAGHKLLGESKVQELQSKYERLPEDIEWHMVGHLQRNKVKHIVPFIAMIHSVDRWKLLKEIDKQARKVDRVINCLLQVHIAEEETKFGFSKEELFEMLQKDELGELLHVNIAGLMGMATFTEDEDKIRSEFRMLKGVFDEVKANYQTDKVQMKELSMGMTNDYRIAIEEGSTMVRIGTAIFGERNY